MDGHDRTKLSAIEKARQEHMKKYGSMLYCEERDTICSFMFEAWITGCRRRPCIKDDPEDQKLQERIQKKREQNEKNMKQKDTKGAPIRNQSAQIKSYEQQKWDEIHRLEQESAKAFRNNNPRKGETLFNRARIMRGDLRKYIEEKKGVKNDHNKNPNEQNQPASG